jgi:hypothetical protein
LTEKGVEAPEVALPKAPVALQPDFQFLEGRWAQSVNAALRVDANVDESGVAEDAQVFRNLRLAETQAADEVTDRAGPVAQKFNDVKAVGLGEGSEGCQHDVRICPLLHIPVKEYVCRGIYDTAAFNRMPRQGAKNLCEAESKGVVHWKAVWRPDFPKDTATKNEHGDSSMLRAQLFLHNRPQICTSVRTEFD